MPPRSPRTRKAGLAQWRRAKQREGSWVTDPQPCAMILPTGKRCSNPATGQFGYCDTCWKGGRPATS